VLVLVVVVVVVGLGDGPLKYGQVHSLYEQYGPVE
jgi:hypothetical protein